MLVAAMHPEIVDLFDIQMRLQPWTTSAAVKSHHAGRRQRRHGTVTFDAGLCADTVYVDGTLHDQPDRSRITLNGGTLTQITPTTWQVN